MVSGKVDKKGFNDLNDVAGRMLCHLTSSSRFNGEMNVDMNEICTNLVPFPKLQFLMTALSPQRNVGNPRGIVVGGSSGGSTRGNLISASSSAGANRVSMQRAFGDILGKKGQLSAVEPCAPGSSSITLASAFLARGSSQAIPLSDFMNCVTSARTTSLKFPSWNPDACKIGLCNTAAPGESMSVLAVYNNTAFGSVLERQQKRFNMLFRRKAMLHHYTEFMPEEEIAFAEQSVDAVIADYRAVERGQSVLLRDDQTRLLMERLFPAF